MIVTKIQGGLGNQLFQWAYTKNLTTKHSCNHILDISLYSKNISHITKRNFSLDQFQSLDLITENKSYDNDYDLIIDDFKFKELTYDPNKIYYLDGYWQSEKYFKESESVIKESLSPNQILKEKLLKFDFKNKKLVSLHVRRTDYITSNGFHPLIPLLYYENAVEMIGDYDNILIFSDDINWCKENLNFKNSIFIDGLTDVESLYLMSYCHHNIIANSSFSWWGAWLNSNPDKIVVAPLTWFGENVKYETENIIPENWIRI
jgi:hypothetical protein